MAVRQYQELIVWQRAMDLVMRVYELTESFPSKELFGLTNQLRRASVSIPSNIAEGQGRNSTREFMRHISIARGSLQEVETQLLIANMLNLVAEQDKIELLERTAEVSRLMTGLSKSLGRMMSTE
jgi:four helix bundle protein